MNTRALTKWLRTGACLTAIAAQVACTPYASRYYRQPLMQTLPTPQGYSYPSYNQSITSRAGSYPAPPPPASAAPAVQSESGSGPSLGAWLLGGLIVGALLSGGSSSEPTQSSASQDAFDRLQMEQERRRHEAQQRENDADSSRQSDTPDTSIGCAWGDQAYGTCH